MTIPAGAVGHVCLIAHDENKRPIAITVYVYSMYMYIHTRVNVTCKSLGIIVSLKANVIDGMSAF